MDGNELLSYMYMYMVCFPAYWKVLAYILEDYKYRFENWLSFIKFITFYFLLGRLPKKGINPGHRASK